MCAMLNEKRINNIKKTIKRQYFNGYEDIKSQNMRTMMVKVITKPKGNSLYLSEEHKKLLDQLLNDAYDKRLLLLKECYKMFQQNPMTLIEEASSVINIEKKKPELELYEENGENFPSTFICTKCSNPEYVYKNEGFYLDKNQKQRSKTKYFSCCKNLEHTKKAIELKRNIDDEINEDTGDILNTAISFGIEKFKRNSLYGKLYTEFAKKGGQFKNYSSARFYESIISNVAGEICSFLDKYYNIQKEILIKVKRNIKLFSEIKNKANELQLKIPFELLNKFSSKEEVEEYNSKISYINMWINENLYQKNEVNKRDFKKLEKLKGFPTFPELEQETHNLSEEERKKNIDDIIKKHEERSEKFWCNIETEKFEEIILSWKPYNDKKNKEKKVKEKIAFLFEYYAKKYNYDFPRVYASVLNKINKKINSLKKHLLEEKEDNRSKKAFNEWYIGKSIVLFEYLRQNSFDDFIKERNDFDKIISINKGFISKKENESKIYEITGFSENKKASIIKQKLDDDKIQYLLMLNPYKKKGIFKIDDKGNYDGFKTEGKNDKKRTYNCNWKIEDALSLPLSLGTRQGREYLWNTKYNFENQGITLNNARIIKKKNEKTNEEEYYVAITFTKLKSNDFSQFANIYKTIIGVDRGEKIPVVATITDLDGNVIETQYLGEEHYNKQKSIQSKKERQSSQTGKYNSNLLHKAKNISDNMVEKIAIDLLYYAIKYDGVIIFEDLSRGFGRSGRKTLMGNRQYTKIEDYLIRKLKEEGLSNNKSNVVVNTRNGLFGKILARHTSKTCSNCGSIFFKKGDIDKHIDNLYLDHSDNIWKIKRDNENLNLNIEYDSYDRTNNRKIILNANEQILKLLENKDLNNLSKTRKKDLGKIILRALNPRKKQDSFICPLCGYSTNADEQASINIARRWIFERWEEIKVMKNKNFDKKKQYKSSKERIRSKVEKNSYSYNQAWEDFYTRMIKEKWRRRN
jgi:ribosomal protein S15P/S13E